MPRGRRVFFLFDERAAGWFGLDRVVQAVAGDKVREVEGLLLRALQVLPRTWVFTQVMGDSVQSSASLHGRFGCLLQNARLCPAAGWRVVCVWGADKGGTGESSCKAVARVQASGLAETAELVGGKW